MTKQLQEMGVWGEAPKAPQARLFGHSEAGAKPHLLILSSSPKEKPRTGKESVLLWIFYSASHKIFMRKGSPGAVRSQRRWLKCWRSLRAAHSWFLARVFWNTKRGRGFSALPTLAMVPW